MILVLGRRCCRLRGPSRLRRGLSGLLRMPSALEGMVGEAEDRFAEPDPERSLSLSLYRSQNQELVPVGPHVPPPGLDTEDGQWEWVDD